jgi:hypothetical protein
VLDADTVVYRRRNPLGATEVTLRGLHGDMAKKELNLLSSPPASWEACGFTFERIGDSYIGQIGLLGRVSSQIGG